MKKELEYKFVDLFAGIGGFHYALKMIDKKAKPVLVSEIDKHAKKEYISNHKYKGEIKNIREIHAEEVEDHDILFGGFPCQTFSNAGKKLGFLDETKGTLFFEIVRLLKSKKPKFVLLENVKHLSKHDEGRTWETIRDGLRELGYKVPEHPLLLSPHEFGIPQIRWRVFIPAILSDEVTNKDMEFDFSRFKTQNIKPLSLDKEVKKETILKDEKTLNAINAWGDFVKNVKRPEGRTLPVIWIDYLNDKIVPNINNMPDWKRKYIKDMQMVYKQNKKYIDDWKQKNKVDDWGKRERKLEWQAGKENFDIKNSYLQLRQSGMRFKKKGIFPTLVAMVQTSLIFHKNQWRFLSVDEVQKLQSFPNSFKPTVVKYQTYKQFGNSVNVKVVNLVLQKLLTVEDSHE